MRVDVKSIEDFKFPLLGLVCSCLSLSLGPFSVVCVDSASQRVWYSFRLCPPGLLTLHVVSIFWTVVLWTTL